MKTAASRPPAPSKVGRTLLWAGFISGALDLGFATVEFLLHGKTFPSLLKAIAGGLLGREASAGGPGVAWLGLACHFCISFGAATVYYLASRKIGWLNRHPVWSGLIFGLLVYEFMNTVVLPLSAYHKPLAFPPLFKLDVLSHLFFVGLTIALIVRRNSK